MQTVSQKKKSDFLKKSFKVVLGLGFFPNLYFLKFLKQLQFVVIYILCLSITYNIYFIFKV